jgi:His/Glu/Gln/Arg/opine family amino acid ABC transporter permease subunit
MTWDELAVQLPGLWDGVLITLLLAGASFLLGGVLGLPLALARISSRRWLAGAAGGFITLVMAIPIVILLLWLYYGLPIVTGILLPDLFVLILALALNQTVIMAENYRSGLRAVPAGQRDGALMLSLSRWQTLRHVVLPQMLRAVVPLLASSSIVLVKDSAIATFIGTNDLLNAARNASIATFRPLELLSIAALLYFVLTYPIALLAARLERRMAGPHRTPGS